MVLHKPARQPVRNPIQQNPEGTGIALPLTEDGSSAHSRGHESWGGGLAPKFSASLGEPWGRAVPTSMLASALALGFFVLRLYHDGVHALAYQRHGTP